MTNSIKKVILVILDGFGISLRDQGNAITNATTPTLDYLERNYPLAALKASGIAVGLSWHEPGNSEVGHMTLGTGRILYQYLPRIIRSLRDGSFFKNKTFLGAVKHVQKRNSTLHLMGLLGSGSVHSYIDHLYGLLELAQREKIGERVRLHIFTDGRDSLPTEGAKFIRSLQERLQAMKVGRIASVQGRFYAMDRDLNWERTQKAYELLTQGKGQKVLDPVVAIRSSYDRGILDEHLEPLCVVGKDQKPLGLIKSGDAVIFFNYREDRARQLTRAFVTPKKVGFPAKKIPELFFVTLTEYEKGLPVQVAFPWPEIKNCLSEVLSDAGKKQLHMAETEKYAHVTYFFNGLEEKPFPGEDRDLVPSLDVKTFNKVPEMKAAEITNRLRDHIEGGKYDFIVVNYANCDMVAHTGDFEATVKAVESIDKNLKILLTLCEDSPGTFLMITSDHGNAEVMIDPYTGEKLTEHSTNDVPLFLVNPLVKMSKDGLDIFRAKRTPVGLLSDVAPTVLSLLGLSVPQEMTGRSILDKMGIVNIFS